MESVGKPEQKSTFGQGKYKVQKGFIEDIVLAL